LRRLTRLRTQLIFAAWYRGHALHRKTLSQCHESSPQLTKIAVLLTRKQHLLSRLEEYPGPNERLEIEARLDKIDAELNALDNPDRL
jgi:hypothetical protein